MTMSRFRKYAGLLLAAAAAAAAFTACRSAPAPAVLAREADLVVYTAQEEAVYEPVIKEFQERTGYRVEVREGTSRELQERLSAQQKGPEWDVIFGVGIETLEESKGFLQPYESSSAELINDLFRSRDHSWTSFSALPLVIMYNTNVVTYRELPEGWMSLLEPRWKGRIAFLDPVKSDMYSNALVTAVETCAGEEAYLQRLMGNLDYRTLDSISEVNSGIVDGRYSLGVTLEESAQALRLGGADVDYIYPREGTSALPDGTAIVKGGRHLQAAEEFLDFTVSRDVQQMLVTNLNRRSVRADVPPLSGLDPISRLKLVTMDLKVLSGEKAAVMARWNRLMKEYERGAGG